MTGLLDLIPPWLKLAVVGALLAAVAGGFFALKASWGAEGAAKVQLADQKAVIDQQQRDAALSAKIIDQQRNALAALSERAGAIEKRLTNAPATTGCGPVMRDASRGLHELFGRASAPPAGR